MTVPPTGAEDVPQEPGDVADLVPEGDAAEQARVARPDDEDQDVVPDAERVVPDLDEP